MPYYAISIDTAQNSDHRDKKKHQMNLLTPLPSHLPSHTTVYLLDVSKHSQICRHEHSHSLAPYNCHAHILTPKRSLSFSLGLSKGKHQHHRVRHLHHHPNMLCPLEQKRKEKKREKKTPPHHARTSNLQHAATIRRPTVLKRYPLLSSPRSILQAHQPSLPPKPRY